MEEGGGEKREGEVDGGACACSTRGEGVAVGRRRKEESLLLWKWILLMVVTAILKIQLFV